MPVITIKSLDEPGVEVYSRLTDHQLRQDASDPNGLFIAESPKVIRVAMAAGFQPLSMLCEERHIEGDAADIIREAGDIPVYTGDRALLTELTGYKLTRGVLCAMRRKVMLTPADICKGKRRIAVIQGVCDTTNIGSIFRSAAALGIGAVLLTRDSCDPLNRRAVRVSMGSVFLVPWTWIDGPVQQLNDMGFKTVAMALAPNDTSLDDPKLMAEHHLAIVLGTEGDGLPKEAIAASDYIVKIPMAYGADSLNVGAAAAVAFWQLRDR